METLLIYFLKANGLIISFFVVYYIFLRKETFFSKNRWFLIAGLIASVVLPLITFTKTIWVKPNPIIFKTGTYSNSLIVNPTPYEPVTISWDLILMYVYLFVALFFISKILIELVSFFKIIKAGNRTKQNKSILIDSPQNANPFSFFNYIVINKQLFSDEEMQHIMQHENIHISDKHSIDVLLVKLFCSIFWANPIIWCYKKEMIQNLEYCADYKAAANVQNRTNYQKTLLKVVTQQNQLGIANQFYQSLIKKRIVMLNKNQSNQKKSWKFALILPVLSLFMLLFQVETVAQVKEQVAEETNYAVSSNYSSTLTKNTTDKELKELEVSFSNEYRKLIISDVTRNKKGKIIEIKLLFDTGKTYHRVLHRKSNNPINNIQIYIKTDEKGVEDCGFIETNEKLGAVKTSNNEQIEIEGFEKNNNFWSLDNIKKNGQDALLIVNGKIMKRGEKIKFSLNEELGDVNELAPEEFEKKYNQKATENVIYYEITTIKNKDFSGKWLNKTDKEKPKNELENDDLQTSSYGITYETSSSEDNILRIKEDKSVDYKKALILVNQEKISFEDLDKIDPNTISEIITFNGNEKIIKKYGEDAKNGIVIITTKSKIPVAEANDKEDFKLENKNSGFVITKRSKEDDLLFYKSTLSKNGIEFTYNNVKRNSNNEITSITLFLKRGLENIQLKVKSDIAIENYFIGTDSEGKIIIRKNK